MPNIQIPEHIFRGYDIRGVVDKDLNERMIRLLAKGYATFLYHRQINEVVIGCDNRLSSEEYKSFFIDELTESGVNVVDIGLSLSQIIYFAQYYYLSKGGVMITGSHNPKEFNGMKLAVGFSDTMLSEEVQELKKIIQEGNFQTFPGRGSLKKDDVFPAYKKDLLKRIPVKIQRFKVVIDTCNSTPGVFLPDILRSVSCEVIEQNTKLDGNFPNGTPDPTERKVQQRLAKRVLAENADMGFSYDADGDRVGVVDGQGNLIWNDTLVSLFAKDILDFLPGSKIVYNTLCSKQVTEVIQEAGGLPVMWLTGHSFIKAKLKEERAAFGGELSGHFFFVDNFYGHDDGAFSTLRLLSYLSRTNQTLSQAVSVLPRYISSPEIKLGCPDEVKLGLIDNQITKDLKTLYPQAEYIDIDGIRLDTKTKMVIMRASQNGPYITVKYEGKTEDEYNYLKQQLSKILHQYEEIDFSTGVNTEALD